MKILIIEDDENKTASLSEITKESFPKATVLYARSQNGGIAKLIESMPDVVLLDMSMPYFDVGPHEDGYQTNAFAGSFILHQMARRRMKSAVVVVTAFSRLGDATDAMDMNTLDSQLHQSFSEMYVGYIHYDVTLADWKPELQKLLSIAARKSGVIN